MQDWHDRWLRARSYRAITTDQSDFALIQIGKANRKHGIHLDKAGAENLISLLKATFGGLNDV